MSGYIKIDRALFDHPVVGFHVPAPRAANGKRPVPPFMAWEWLCAKAAFRPHQINNKGRAETLERGQLLAARAHLASEWGWTEQNVRTFLKNLHAHNMIKINQSAGHYTAVLTVCNYDVYQGALEEGNQSANQSLTRESPETNHTEGREEGKEKKEESFGDFDQWWDHYPRKINKQHARKKYTDAIKKHGATHEQLLDAVRRRIGGLKASQPEYIPHAATWLSQQRWRDGEKTNPQRARQEAAGDDIAKWRELFGYTAPNEEGTDALTH